MVAWKPLDAKIVQNSSTANPEAFQDPEFGCKRLTLKDYFYLSTDLFGTLFTSLFDIQLLFKTGGRTLDDAEHKAFTVDLDKRR